jgi:hypothetical protein
MSEKGSQYLDAQEGTNGSPVGPLLTASIFVPPGYGVVFTRGDVVPATYWQLRLALNPDGTTFIGEDNKPTIELIQVNI